MSVDDTTNLAPIIAGNSSGSHVRETRLSEDYLPSKYPVAATASTPSPTNTDEVIDAKTAPSVATTTAKATIASSSPVRVTMTLDGHMETASEPIYSLPVDNGPLIDDEPYIDDGVDQDDAFVQRDRRVQNWLAQQCRFSLVFGESEQAMLEELHDNLRGKGKAKALPEGEYDDEDRGVAATGIGALRRQRSYLDSLEILGSTPPATTAPTTVTRTSSGSSRQQGSSLVFSSPAIATEGARADSPLLGFGCGPEPAHDHSVLDAGNVDPLTRPARDWVRDLPRDDGASASEWGRFAVRLRDDPSEDFVGEDRDKPLPMLPPPSTRTSPIPDELLEGATSSADTTPGADDLIVTLTAQIPQERTPSAVPSNLPAASTSLTVAPVSPQLSTFLSVSPSRPMSSHRSSAYPSAHPSPLPAMQATPLPPSSPPTRRQSRAVLNAFMTPVDFGDDYNTEQGQYLSGLPSSPAGNRNTLVANPNPAAGSANTPNAHSLATVRSRSGSVGLRNAVYINSEEVIERLDALLLRSPTQTHQNVEDELEDMAFEMKDELASRETPVAEAEHDDGDSSDTKSEGMLEAEEILGELGLGLKGLEDNRLHEMPAVARETELQSIVKAEERREEEPQPLDTLHEHEPDLRATDVTSSVITTPEVVIASPIVPVPVVPVTRSRTSSISLAAAGRVPSGPSPAVLHQMHTRETSSASSSRRMSPSSPSAKLSRSQSQSSPQLHHQSQHAHSYSHVGFSRSGTPSSPSSRSNSNQSHSHTGSVAVNYLSGHSSNYSNGSIVIPGIAPSMTGHSRSSSSILLVTPATSSIHIALPVALPPAEPGVPRPTRPPPAPPLDLGLGLGDHVMNLPIDNSFGLDIAADEFYGDVLGSEESSQKSFLRRYQDSEKERGFTPEHVEYDGVGDETLMGTALQHGARHDFEEHGDGEDPAQLLMALGLEDRVEEFRGIKFPSAPSIREEDEEPYGGPAALHAEPLAYVGHSADIVDDHGENRRFIEDPDRPTMQRSMSRWSLTSSTMGDDAPKDKKEVKKKKSRKSFSSPFAAALAEAMIDGPSTPSAQDGNEGFSTPVPKDGNATTSPASGEKKVKRGRLASFISRLSGVGQNGGIGSPNHSGPTTPSSAVPPVPSLPVTPVPYAFGVSGYGMDLSDIVLPKPSLRQGTLMPSPDIAEPAPKKLNTKASKDKLVAHQHTSRQRSNSAADLLRKMPGTPTNQSPSVSSSNLQQAPTSQPPPINSAVEPHAPVVDPRRPGLVKSMSTPAIGPSALRPSLQAKKALIQIQTQIAPKRGRPTIIFDESMPPTPSSAATSLINEDDEEEDYGVETNDLERLRREKEYDERWVLHTQVATAMEPQQQGAVEAEPYTPPLPTKVPTIAKPTLLGMVASHGHVVDIPPTLGDFDQKRRLRSLSNLTAVTQGLQKSPPASASTTSFASHQKISGSAPKSAKGSGFRGFVERMGLGGSNSNNGSNTGASYPTSPRSPSTEALQSFPSPPPSASFTQPTSHSPTTSLSFNGSQSPGVFSSGGILGKKTPKRKLVISGVAMSDTIAYEAVKSWCEDFGAVREITRADNGCLYVDFESAETAETVCRIQAQVFIKGAGSVQLSWYSKKRPL